MAVQGTTEEASISKLSAANLGYFEDSFLQYFVRPAQAGGYRRSPLVHRGYASRVAAIRSVITQFLECCETAQTGNSQIVNLGAGLDSLSFWILTTAALSAHMQQKITIFEVDHAEIVSRKSQIIARTPQLAAALGDRKDRLRLIGADLRDVENLKSSLCAAGMDANAPTLFIAECVLIYMHAEHSDKLLKWTSEAVHNQFSAVAVYEQTNPHDAFGKVMVKTLAERECPLLGIFAYPSLELQFDRFVKAGYDEVDVRNLNDIFDHCTEDVERIKKIEMFDEFEEWRLMQSHYFVAVASKFPNDLARRHFGVFANIWSRHLSK